ncbi:MAG: hypothetical protein ACTSPK_08360 [Candidatus Heimdallarchaeota archaeon]
MADNILNGHKDEIQSDNGYVLKAYNLTKKYNEGLPSMVTAIEDLTFAMFWQKYFVKHLGMYG